jgi:ABC-type sugar transport system permease subunit
VAAIFGIEELSTFVSPVWLAGLVGWAIQNCYWTLILLATWQFGSPMLIFLAGLKQIPSEYYEAASIDGAGPWAKFLKITLPLLTPIIFFNLSSSHHETWLLPRRLFSAAALVAHGYYLCALSLYPGF